MSRFAAALARRAEQLGIDLDSDLILPFETYFSLLTRWNRRLNLTSLPVEELGDEALDRLLLEPVAAAPLFPEQARSWIDLGSGGGSPAIPLKLLRPSAALTMIESRTRKVAFLREAIRELGLIQARAEALRFEEASGSGRWANTAEVVTARAVRVDDGFVATVRGLLRDQGRLLVFASSSSGPIGSRELELESSRELLPAQSPRLNIYKLVS